MSDTNEKIKGNRTDYGKHSLSEGDVGADPITQFNAWLHEAMDAGELEANAFTLCTTAANGVPSARIVLLRDVDVEGFYFYTNYNSQKGREIAASQGVCINFFWPKLERQVRVVGDCAQVSAARSDAYFAARPRGTQIGCWASEQSNELDGREALETRLAHFTEKFEGQPVPRPEHWGGYVIQPREIEFWQGRPSRLHDRLRYEKDAAGGWSLKRLAP